MVLSNCAIDAVNRTAKKEEWCAQGDDFRTFLRNLVTSLAHAPLPGCPARGEMESHSRRSQVLMAVFVVGASVAVE
jgi:hypothetical protein